MQAKLLPGICIFDSSYLPGPRRLQPRLGWLT